MGQTLPMERQITIRDLLTMTSGLPSFGNIPVGNVPVAGTGMERHRIRSH